MRFIRGFERSKKLGKYVPHVFFAVVALLIVVSFTKSRAIIKAGLNITSGYRTPWRNYKVGGSMFSQHLLGLAWDVTPVNSATREKLARIGFGNIMNEGDHYHASVV